MASDTTAAAALVTAKEEQLVEAGAASDQVVVEGENEAVPAAGVINLKVKLPSGSLLSFACALEETVSEIKVGLVECEELCCATSYELFIGDEQLDKFTTIDMLSSVEEGSVLEVRPVPYSAKTLANHVGRILELQDTADSNCALPAILLELRDLTSVVRPRAKQEALQQQQKKEQTGTKLSASKKKKAKKKKKKAAAQASASSRAKSAATAMHEAFSVDACLDTDLRRLFPNLQEIEGASRGPLLVSNSKWGQPSPAREAHGDLAYLKVKTTDGQSYQVTGSTTGFFLNKSTKERFNANSSSKTFHGLTDLIASINPTFEKEFQQLLAKRVVYGRLGPFMYDPVLETHEVRSWLQPFSRHRERGEPTRTVRVADVSVHATALDDTRDWNNEIQSIRDMLPETMMDAIRRDRGLFTVKADFVKEAIQGAIKIVNNDVIPANPVDPPALHIFVMNNIFYSYANGDKFAAEQEDATPSEDDAHGYKLANQDILGTSLYNHANIKGIHTVMTTMVTYKGVRVFAQGIIPGILQPEPAPILYGSMTNGKSLDWTEDVHELMSQAADRLCLAVHDFQPEDGEKRPMASSIATKCIRGTDNRLYIMDLECPSVYDVAWCKRWAIHRPELLRRFADHKKREYTNTAARVAAYNERIDAHMKQIEEEKAKKAEEEALKNDETAENKDDETDETKELEKKDQAQETDGAEERASTEEVPEKKEMPPFKMPRFNPNLGLESVKLAGKVVGSEEELAEQNALYKNLTVFLQKVAIPTALEDIIASEIPVDSEKLKFVLQARGVNLRYLGAMAALMPESLEYQHQFLHREMLVRSAKHLFNLLIVSVPRHQHAEAAAHFLTCLVQGISSVTFVSLKRTAPAEDDLSLDILSLKQQSLHRQLLAISVRDFKATLAGFEPLYKNGKVHQLPLLRGFSLKVGLAVRPRKYNFAKPFTPNDIAAFGPIVKTALEPTSTALGLLEAGDMLLMRGKLEEAYESYSEAMSFCHHTTGSLNYSAAMCFLKLAEVLFRAGDVGQAVETTQTAIIILERVRGPDRHDVAVAYLTLATYLESAGQPLPALAMHKRALYLFLLFGGEQHIGVGSMHLRIGHLLQELEAHEVALQHLSRALEHFEALFGPDHPKTGSVCHMMAQVHSFLNDNKAALELEKRNHDILAKALGPEHEQTAQAGIWMKQFTLKAVQEARDARETTKSLLASGGGVPSANGSEAPLFSRPIADILKYVNSDEEPKQSRRARHPFPTGRRLPKTSAFPTKP